MYSNCEKMEKFQSEMQLALHLIFLVLPRSHQAIRRPDPEHTEASLSIFLECGGLWAKAAPKKKSRIILLLERAEAQETHGIPLSLCQYLSAKMRLQLLLKLPLYPNLISLSELWFIRKNMSQAFAQKDSDMPTSTTGQCVI
ncbi:hypothetical protein BTVI_43230 [Pitangus sulphuratus]|nr:hypothetical protein BTVI_43230 [Pitangus sulphuratus]